MSEQHGRRMVWESGGRKTEECRSKGLRGEGDVWERNEVVHLNEMGVGREEEVG